MTDGGGSGLALRQHAGDKLPLRKRASSDYRKRRNALPCAQDRSKEGIPLVGALPVGAPLGRTRARQRPASSVHRTLTQTHAVNNEGRRQGWWWGSKTQETLHLPLPPHPSTAQPPPRLFPSPPRFPVNLLFLIHLLRHRNSQTVNLCTKYLH